MALPDRTRIAYCAGPVDSHEPQSFRSEATGMLSVICFLSRIREWTHSDITISGIIASDHLGLVTRVKEQAAMRYPVPNLIFQSDWDIVEAIAQISKKKTSKSTTNG
jgi:hypothetical protein